jgi:hypothetical protein
MLSRPPLSHPSRPVPPAPNSRPTTSIYPVFLGMYPPGILALPRRTKSFCQTPKSAAYWSGSASGTTSTWRVMDYQASPYFLCTREVGNFDGRPSPCLVSSERQGTWTATCVHGWDRYHPMSTGCATQRWSTRRSC